MASADESMLNELQCESFRYFTHETNLYNGLVRDKTRSGWPSSIAATGMALAAYPMAIERGFITREAATEHTRATLTFFWKSPQAKEPDATGYKGFYYHFLDMKTGRRVWNCELSTVDTAFLLAGMLAAAEYFDRDTQEEDAIRSLVHKLYARTDWRWALNGKATLTHGWRPESGFMQYRWEGYSEALLLYALALGSPTFPLPEESWAAFTATYTWKRIYDYELLYSGPLFTHQLSQVWIDCRGIQDSFMKDHGLDYFENSRRASYVQQEYAIRNPKGFAGYGEYSWGLTACDGPGPMTCKVNGIERTFLNYVARGAPYGPDDGTLAPWAVVASLPFAPELVLATIRHLEQLPVRRPHPCGFKASFNPTYPDQSGSEIGWVSSWHYGINQGPIVLMIENYRTGLLWKLMRQCPYVVRGLRRAGFSGGWL